jgi:hypothetical protein
LKVYTSEPFEHVYEEDRGRPRARPVPRSRCRRIEAPMTGTCSAARKRSYFGVSDLRSRVSSRWDSEHKRRALNRSEVFQYRRRKGNSKWREGSLYCSSALRGLATKKRLNRDRVHTVVTFHARIVVGRAFLARESYQRPSVLLNGYLL